MSDQDLINIKRSKNILLCLTGSVASIKLVELVKSLHEKQPNFNICIIPTRNALKFVPADFFDRLDKPTNDTSSLAARLELLKSSHSTRGSGGRVFSFSDEDEWTSWQKRDDPVLHIELRKWADICLIAPLDANTLAKISNGICDNLLTSVLRAWDLANIGSKPVVICPAMNTAMYLHPITRRQLDVLTNEFGFQCVDSIEKTLMCGDKGVGAMARVEDIAAKVFELSQRLNQFE